jgi:5-methylcytosine-specific restriction enzyme A
MGRRPEGDARADAGRSSSRTLFRPCLLCDFDARGRRLKHAMAEQARPREEWRRWYKSPAWQAMRSNQLSADPLCSYCGEQAMVVAASVVDHIRPHRGNYQLFFDPLNLQSLCKACHDRRKQREELAGYDDRLDPSGWPISRDHPANAPARRPPGGGQISRELEEGTGAGPVCAAPQIKTSGS